MILVLDYGGQYAHLIARKVRQLGVYAEILPGHAKFEEVVRKKPDGIILSGGPTCVHDKNAPRCDKRVFQMGVPIFGICYGHQLIAYYLGGNVEAGKKGEYGNIEMNVKKNRLFKGLKRKEYVWMSHYDTVTKAPPGFKIIGSTKNCEIAAYENDEKKIYGVQFHTEVDHTPNGLRILSNFVNICAVKHDYSLSGLDKKLVKELKKEVKDDGIIMAVSGGVDSLVSSVVLNRVTSKLYCVFVDNGLVRKGETDYVKSIYKEMGFKHFYSVDASKIFLRKLKGVTDPEKKRKIIGHTFIEVFEKKVEELRDKGHIKFLGQGTIYPDRIESAQASGNASVIKTHHNVGGLPAKMKLTPLEPLKDLYKDEVRKLGENLGIKAEYLHRHPFPGPGLGVRIVGEITKERLDRLREADSIFIEELTKAGHYDNVWQALVVLLPVKTVGVMGDSRRYGDMIAIRAVTSIDAMTADWARLPYSLLERASNRIVRNVKDITRVVYDITQKPPATIEYE